MPQIGDGPFMAAENAGDAASRQAFRDHTARKARATAEIAAAGRHDFAPTKPWKRAEAPNLRRFAKRRSALNLSTSWSDELAAV
jgi:hypothetical protein